MPNKNPRNFMSEGGNALILIIILIGLLAALSMTMMKSSQRTSDNMDATTARMNAEKLLRMSKSLEMGVNHLMNANGCGENLISFANTISSRTYTNASASDSCKIFDVAGAGQAYTQPPLQALDDTKSAVADYDHWVITGTHCVLGLGSDDNNACTSSEVALIATVPFVNLATCLQVNNLNGITNPSGAPPTESFDENASAFTGSFSAATDPELGESGGANLVGHATGCFQNSSGSTWANSYVFYHVLLER